MARYKITTEDGKSYAITTEDAPSMDAPQPQQPSGTSWADVPRNYIADVKGQLQGAGELVSRTFPFDIGRKARGEVPNALDQVQMGQQLLKGVVVEGPKQIAETVLSPVESFKKRPLSAALDIGTAVSGVTGLANLGRKTVAGVSRRAAPGILKSTAGIPEGATERAMARPEIFKKAPVPESELQNVVGQPMIEAMKKAKSRVNATLGKAYRRYAGTEGPMQEIIDTPIAQQFSRKEIPLPKGTIGPKESRLIQGDLKAYPRETHNYDQLLVNKNMAIEAFEKGDRDALNYLYKEYIGTPKSDLSLLAIKEKDKLNILTKLKREILQQAKFNLAPVTNAPIDSAKDAAFKKMGSDLDGLRYKLPNGRKLAAVDDAWKSIHDMYDTVQKDLSDPGKAKDTMMRLLKGDHTWLTSGRMKNKVGAIRKAELLSGEKILEPALDELTRQVYNDWAGKGFGAQVLRGVGGGGALLTALTNPVAAVGLAGSTALTSPRVMRGALRASNALGGKIQSTAARLRPVGRAGGAKILLESSRKKK